MPVPRFCPQPQCPNHHQPSGRWRVRFGHYLTRAHGLVQRYRCCGCGHTLSDQTPSLHYYAKRRVPLSAVWLSLLGGSSLREIGLRYRLSPTTVQNAILRLGRQAMAAHLLLLQRLAVQPQVVIDGLRSLLCSQDYPVELLSTVSSTGELILHIGHFITRRGGRCTEAQKQRMQLKYQCWAPAKGAVSQAIRLVLGPLWNHLQLAVGQKSQLESDEHPLYRQFLDHDRTAVHLRQAQLLSHRQTPSTAPRTLANPLFPVNYIDRLLRHRLKEHTRQSISCGKNATLQMHRAWIFAHDHNCRRPHRVRHPRAGSHAQVAGVTAKLLSQLSQGFFSRRLRTYRVQVPLSIRLVWLAQLPTPPVRWKVGQKGTSVRVPDYARRDLADAYQQAS